MPDEKKIAEEKLAAEKEKIESFTDFGNMYNFKKDFKYEVKEVEEKDGVEVYEGESLIDENGKEKGEGENWINVGYKHSGPYAKVLSNLFPYEFVFKGKKLNSI